MSRRRLLAGGGLTIGGALAGAGIVALGGDDPPSVASSPVSRVPFHGARQSGVDTPAQANATFLALDLRDGTDRAALRRMLRLLSDDAARLTQGRPALADPAPELAVLPARLTITFGFGPRVYALAGRPSPVAPLPAFGVDRLQARWTGGDLLLQVCADDPLTIAHAQRMLLNDARAFARLRWTQRGFRRPRDVQADGVTQRNVLGQIDGTRNPELGSPAFDTAVWNPDGSTTLVVRRVRAELATWDAADSGAKEFAVGRRLDTGAPLTGRRERDEPDLAATDALGLPVIADAAHIRRAHVGEDRLRIFRRPYNYDEPAGPDGQPDAGLVFCAYQRSVSEQFVPIQRALDEADLLNQWITPIGSAVFAIPPGCLVGGFVGDELLA